MTTGSGPNRSDIASAPRRARRHEPRIRRRTEDMTAISIRLFAPTQRPNADNGKPDIRSLIRPYIELPRLSQDSDLRTRLPNAMEPFRSRRRPVGFGDAGLSRSVWPHSVPVRHERAVVFRRYRTKPKSDQDGQGPTSWFTKSSFPLIDRLLPLPRSQPRKGSGHSAEAHTSSIRSEGGRISRVSTLVLVISCRKCPRRRTEPHSATFLATRHRETSDWSDRRVTNP